MNQDMMTNNIVRESRDIDKGLEKSYLLYLTACPPLKWLSHKYDSTTRKTRCMVFGVPLVIEDQVSPTFGCTHMCIRSPKWSGSVISGKKLVLRIGLGGPSPEPFDSWWTDRVAPVVLCWLVSGQR